MRARQFDTGINLDVLQGSVRALIISHSSGHDLM